MYENVTFRYPVSADGPALRRIASDSRVLAVNSGYYYALMVRHFSATCLVAEIDSRVCGYIIGYCPPAQPDTLFVWQVGVGPEWQGKGMGRKMLISLVQKKGPKFLEATIDPDNRASVKLFKSVARQMGASYDFGQAPFFSEADLSGEPAEHLMRIGPFSRRDFQ